MHLTRLFSNRTLTFVAPRLMADENEWEPEPEYPPEHDWRRQLGEVHVKPLFWSMDPPRPARAANYYVRRPNEAEYIMARIEPGDEYGRGLEWFGPLPEPPR